MENNIYNYYPPTVIEQHHVGRELMIFGLAYSKIVYYLLVQQ